MAAGLIEPRGRRAESRGLGKLGSKSCTKGVPLIKMPLTGDPWLGGDNPRPAASWWVWENRPFNRARSLASRPPQFYLRATRFGDRQRGSRFGGDSAAIRRGFGASRLAIKPRPGLAGGGEEPRKARRRGRRRQGRRNGGAAAAPIPAPPDDCDDLAVL